MGSSQQPDLKEERKRFDIIQSVENFDATKLKSTITVEKLLLPNIEGGSTLTCDGFH